MYDPFANLPSVDHLVEGRDYTILDWSFADAAPAAPNPDPACPIGEKMVFGVCRKVGGAGQGEKDWDTSKDTDQEKKIGEEAKKQKSSFDTNKPVTVNGKKYGWAKKNGKAVLVEWGSVAGEKKVGPKQPAAKPKKRGNRSQASLKGQLEGLTEALNRQSTDSGRAAIQQQIDEVKAQLG